MNLIKEAYGYGFAAKKTSLLDAGNADDDTTYQTARDAGRQAEIATVTRFLGSVHIDHFVEVTMAAFYQVAQAVAPITVCVNRATQDTFAGADFKAGMQQIDGKQAMAFVRQRRDTTDPTYDFTNLDRERRQQAFIASVLHELNRPELLTDLPTMQNVMDAVGKNIVVDSDLNPIQFAQQASSLTGGNISFTTLPITGFGWSREGASINTVDVDGVQDTVKSLLAPAPSQASNNPAQAAPDNTRPAPAAPTLSHGSGDAASPSEQSPSVPAPASQPPSTYSDWSGALQGGGVPCVK